MYQSDIAAPGFRRLPPVNRIENVFIDLFKKCVNSSLFCYNRCCSLFFFLYIQFTLFEQKIYSHQVVIYQNVPGIPVRKPLQNRQIDSWRTTGCVSLGVICANLLTRRHLLMNKKGKNSRYTNIKIMII